MSVEAYEALIAAAKKEIANCKQMISIINSVTNNVTNCVKALYNSADSLDAGLVVNSKYESAPIKDIASSLKSFGDNLNNSIGLIDSRIKELEDNIVEWEKSKKSLLAYLASLKNKLFGKDEENEH